MLKQLAQIKMQRGVCRAGARFFSASTALPVRRCLLFPGQGTQVPGMGRDLAQTFTAAREVFDEVDSALGENLSRLMFDSDSADKLAHTENAQPAILAHSIAAFRAVHRELGSPKLPAFASCGLGHSVGEYSALVATGGMSLWDAVRLVRVRGRAMQSACVPNEEYAMAALMGAPPAEASAENKFAIEIEKLCHSVLADVQSMKSRTRVCSIANVNSRSQVVLSGHRDAVQLVTEKAKSAKLARRVTFLNVSAPFHCSIMQPAVEILSAAISRIKLDDSTIPLISNHNAEALRNADDIVRHLLLQVVQPVQFDACLRSVIAAEPNTQFVEFGPGRVLTALADNVMRESVKSRQPSAANNAESANDASLMPSVAALSTVEHCVAFIKSQR